MSAAAPAQLGARTWTADQIHFQRWLAQARPDRRPRSQRELAAQLEVREATLSEWKRLDGFHEAVYALAHASITAELPAVLHAQLKRARAGSLAHAQWVFELAGIWSPKQQVEHTGVAEIRISFSVDDDRERPDRSRSSLGG